MIVSILNTLTFEPFHKVMIGDKQISPQEAYKIFISFLKEYGYYGNFLKQMMKYYDTSYQMYKKHFLLWSSQMSRWQDRHYRYHWYTDRALLFPFMKKEDFGVWHNAEEIIGMWKIYCQENKLTNSIIIRPIPKKDEYIDTRGYTWSQLLEECDYPTTATIL